MEFKIIEIKNKEVWEDFLLECKEKTFLNSWNWGKFNKMTGNKIWRLGIYSSEQKAMSNEQLIATALVIKVEAKRGTFLFVPHGPAMKYEIGNRKYEVLRIFLDELKKIGEEFAKLSKPSGFER